MRTMPSPYVSSTSTPRALAKLDVNRLNVTHKSRANLLTWRGQFTPQLVDYIVESFSTPDQLVVDPFSGSGTVLLESAARNLPCFGNELNPAAYLMSKLFHLVNFDPPARKDLLDQCKQNMDALLHGYTDLPLTTPANGHRAKYSNLLHFATDILAASQSDSMKSCLTANILFKAEASRSGQLTEAVQHSYDYIASIVQALPYSTSPVDAHLGDARALGKVLPCAAALVVTSPPYINVFNYHQNHRAIIELMDWDPLRIARSEIGSNRSNRGNRFRTVIQYCLDMRESLDAMSESLRPDGVLVLIVGKESNVNRIPFHNGEIVQDLLQFNPCFDQPMVYERRFVNRFGNQIREDVLVARRNDAECRSTLQQGAREVATKHLQAAKIAWSTEHSQALDAAIAGVDEITGSDWYTDDMEDSLGTIIPT